LAGFGAKTGSALENRKGGAVDGVCDVSGYGACAVTTLNVQVSRLSALRVES
jgi:hypothetical protein